MQFSTGEYLRITLRRQTVGIRWWLAIHWGERKETHFSGIFRLFSVKVKGQSFTMRLHCKYKFIFQKKPSSVWPKPILHSKKIQQHLHFHLCIRNYSVDRCGRIFIHNSRVALPQMPCRHPMHNSSPMMDVVSRGGRSIRKGTVSPMTRPLAHTNRNHSKYPADDMRVCTGIHRSHDDVKLSLKWNRQFVMRIKQTPPCLAHHTPLFRVLPAVNCPSARLLVSPRSRPRLLVRTIMWAQCVASS